MVNTQLILIDGTLLTLFFSVFVVGSIIWNPRLWLQDFPADIQAMIPSKTDEEKRQTLIMSIPFFVILFGGFGITAARYGDENGFWALVLHIYLIWQVINVFDLLIIDWCGMMLVDPMNPPLPGTEGAKGYRNFAFHLIGFIKGSVMGVVMALVTAGVVYPLL